MFRRLRSDDGQGLIIVLFATMLILALVVAATTITAAQSAPTRRSVDRAAALAAAEGGVQDFLAKLAACGAPTDCELLAMNGRGSDRIAGSDSSFEWKIEHFDTAEGTVRISSAGTYQHGMGRPVTRTLVADFVAGAQLGDFLYYSTYETQSPELINAQNPEREIPLDNEAAVRVGVSSGLVKWNGTQAYVPGEGGETYPESEMCGHLWYGEHSRESARDTAGSGDVDWAETGTLSDGDVKTHTGTCEVMFSSATEMSGAVYSKDAFLISTSTEFGRGPMFHDKVWTEWKPETGDSEEAMSFRTVSDFPDSEPAQGSKRPLLAPTHVVLPDWETPLSPSCTYRGATQIAVESEGSGQVLVITSPLTPAGSSEGLQGAPECYESRPGDGRTSQQREGAVEGVFEARVPLTPDTTILVADADNADTETANVVAPSEDTARRTPLNSLFSWRGEQTEAETRSFVLVNTDSPDAEPADEAEQQAREQFNESLGTTYDEAGREVRDDLTADEAPIGTGPGELSLREALNESLYAALTKNLDEDRDDTLHPQYVRVPRTADVDEPAAEDDPLPDLLYAWTFEADHEINDEEEPGITALERESDVASFTEESEQRTETESQKATLSLVQCNTEACFDAVIAGLSSDRDPAETISADESDDVTGSVTELFSVTADLTELQTRTTRVSAFPLPGDRTLYSRKKGDIYFQGAVDGALSLVAENNVIVTGDITQTGASNDDGKFSSPDAVALIAKHNVEVYHPVSCATSEYLAETTQGFCPNDLTGLVENMSIADSHHPSRQYVNMAQHRPQRIDAAVYALDGSFYLANHDKGTDLGTLHLNGAVYQEHRGAMGVEWAITRDQHTRPRSGYALDYTYDSTLPTKQFPFVPSDGRTHVGAWTLVGTSEILNEEGNE